MSSLEVTPNLFEKRGTFLTRSASFQKLKCFHLAGSKLSKESLTQLFEKVINHSRTVLQVAFIVLALPTYKLMTMVILWSFAVAKMFGLKLVIENESSAKLQSPESGVWVRISRTKVVAKKPSPSAPQLSSSPSLSNVPVPQDTIEKRLSPEVIPDTIKAASSLKPFANLRVSSKVKSHACLSYCVYGCTAFAYVQLAILLVALNHIPTPPGLIFLSLSSFLIGYIVYKILLNRKPKTSEPPSSPAKPTSPERFRISRTSTRRYLAFHEKTLSKIKLL